MNVDADVVIEDLLEQNKNLTLQNAILRASLRAHQAGDSVSEPPEVESDD